MSSVKILFRNVLHTFRSLCDFRIPNRSRFRSRSRSYSIVTSSWQSWHTSLRRSTCTETEMRKLSSEPENQSADTGNILHCVNNLTAEQLRMEKKIPLNIVVELCKHREASGPFATLEELKKVKKIGPKTFKLVCEKLTADTAVVDGDYVLKYTSPELSPAFIQSLSTVTSVEVCLDSVYFATMTRDLHLMHWNHVTLLGANHLRQLPSQIVEQALHVVNKLPKSSAYLIENRQNRKLNLTYVQLQMFIGRLQMAIQTLLNTDLPTSGQHKVFHMKDSFITKTFDLRVGGERISGQHMVRQIYEEQEQNSGKITVPPEMWDRYNRLESAIYKERYANCLLMTLAFCQHAYNREIQ